MSKIPKKLSRYRVIEEIGRGGMGCVYKAFDPAMDIYLALKVIHFADESKNCQRFIREAKAMAQMSHPNIAKVYNIGNEESVLFIAMDYIRGVSLREFLKNTPIDIRQFCKLMVKICLAMEYAHEIGIIHRDLKPDNILIDKKIEPYIVDFGIAKTTHIEKSISDSGVILGTPRYMSPEQASGEKINHLTDIYALGAIFYEMFAGHSLIQGQTVPEIIYNVVYKEPKPLKKVHPKLSKDLHTICHKSIEKAQEDRYQKAREFADDIKRFLDGKLIEARPASFWQKSVKKLKYYKWPILIAAMTLFLGFSVVLITYNYQVQENSKQAQKFLTEAYSLLKQKNQITDVERKVRISLEASEYLEKAFLLTGKTNIRQRSLQVYKEISKLAKAKKNFLLSYIALKKCLRLGDLQSHKFLQDLEKDKEKLHNKQKNFISVVMRKVLSNSLPEESINWYVFTIVKMAKPFVVKTLIPYLQSDSKTQRTLAIRTLGKLGNKHTKVNDKDSVEWLMELMHNLKKQKNIKEHADEAKEIILALGWLRDSRANKLVYEVRFLSGENSSLWNQTQIAYKQIPLEQINPSDAKEFFVSGQMKALREKYLEAIVDYSKSIKLNPKDPETYNNRGLAYYDLKKYDKAIIDYAQAIKLDNKYVEAYNNRGNVYSYQKKYSKAIADYTQAIKLAPGFSDAYNNRGNTYAYQKEYSKAIADYNQVVKLNPKFLLVYNNRGLAYYDLRNYSKAIADYTQAIELNPRFSLAYLNRGATYKDLGEYDNAIVDYTQAIRLNPGFSESYVNRGLSYSKKQKYNRAIADYTQAIKLKPGFARAYIIRGLAYQILKNYEKSIFDYTQAIKFDASFPDAYNNRGLVYAYLKEYGKAIADYSQAIKLNPKFSEAYTNRGLTYAYQKQYAKAITNYQQSIKLNPNFSLPYGSMGRVYLSLKQYQKAYDNFKIFLKLSPRHPMATQVYKWMQVLKKHNLAK